MINFNTANGILTVFKLQELFAQNNKAVRWVIILHTIRSQQKINFK